MIAEKFVWMLSIYPKQLERLLGKVFQIAGYDYVASADDRGGKDMTVVRVRKFNRIDKNLISP